MSDSGKIRKKRNKFAQVSNHCLQNKNLSLRAKGLYALIQSLIDIPNFILYKSSLQTNFCNEGRDAFNKTWNELKDNGYLKVIRISDEKGHFNYEYELLDSPEEPYIDSPCTGSPTTVNQPTNNTKENNTYKNTNFINNDINTKIEELEKNLQQEIVEEKVSTLSKSEIKKEINLAEQKNFENNKEYDCFNNKTAQEIRNLTEDFSDFRLNFNEKVNNLKIKMFDADAVVPGYLVACLDNDNNKPADNALDFMNGVMESFHNADRLALLNMSPSNIKEIYDLAFKICKDEKPIKNKPAYFSQIVRSYISRQN